MGDVLTFERVCRRDSPRPGGRPFQGEAGFFDRRELHKILQLYSRKVMAGEWRDYAISGDETGAVFAVYGNASAMPIFRLAKRPGAGRRDERYQISVGERMLDAMPSLEAALAVLERRKPQLVKQL